MDQITLNDTEWKPLTVAGQSVIAFLDEDQDGETGGIDDVRFVRASSLPLATEFTKSKRIYRPTFAKNNDIALLSIESDTDIFYARCRTGTATVSILPVRNENEQKLDRLLREGKLFYLETVLTAQSAAVSFIWRTGAKKVNFISAIDATLKTTVTMYEGVTVGTLGTLGPLLNRNRSFPDNGLLFTRYTGSVYSGGTLLSTKQLGSSSAPGQSVQSKAADQTGVMKATTDYGLKITPSAACDINIAVLWWED